MWLHHCLLLAHREAWHEGFHQCSSVLPWRSKRWVSCAQMSVHVGSGCTSSRLPKPFWLEGGWMPSVTLEASVWTQLALSCKVEKVEGGSAFGGGDPAERAACQTAGLSAVRLVHNEMQTVLLPELERCRSADWWVSPLCFFH